jgi:hypothetical protein
LAGRPRRTQVERDVAATPLSVGNDALASGFISANTHGQAYRAKFDRVPRAKI